MNFLDGYRNPALVKGLAEKIRQRSTKSVKLMEFCGGHTAAILKHGIRQLLPPQIQLLSGPGCPVCVTANADLDRAIALAKLPGVVSATFGDMLKVPGSNGSLQKVRAEGGEVRIVYSARDALQMAQRNPEKPVVFFGIGFETTAPTVAATILEAKKEAVDNYHVLCLHKLCPPVMKSLLDSREVGIDGILCPGHVSAVIGSDPYGFIPRDYGIACVISGFEPVDILLSIDMLVEQVEGGRPKVEIAYRRGVRSGGNREALRLMESVFEVGESDWRGMGRISDSGLRIRDEYQRFDAEHIFDIDPESTSEPTDCICGDILRATKTPFDCSLFGKGCTPEHPVGPCMVSSEGSCSAHLLYGAHYGR